MSDRHQSHTANSPNHHPRTTHRLLPTLAKVELALFSSILRDDFHPDSDIDLLVFHQPTAKRGLFEKMHMKAEIESMLHREVDLVSKTAIQQSKNWIRRQNILTTAEVIYVA